MACILVLCENLLFKYLRCRLVILRSENPRMFSFEMFTHRRSAAVVCLSILQCTEHYFIQSLFKKFPQPRVLDVRHNARLFADWELKLPSFRMNVNSATHARNRLRQRVVPALYLIIKATYTMACLNTPFWLAGRCAFKLAVDVLLDIVNKMKRRSC